MENTVWLTPMRLYLCYRHTDVTLSCVFEKDRSSQCHLTSLQGQTQQSQCQPEMHLRCAIAIESYKISKFHSFRPPLDRPLRPPINTPGLLRYLRWWAVSYSHVISLMQSQSTRCGHMTQTPLLSLLLTQGSNSSRNRRGLFFENNSSGRTCFGASLLQYSEKINQVK